MDKLKDGAGEFRRCAECSTGGPTQRRLMNMCCQYVSAAAQVSTTRSVPTKKKGKEKSTLPGLWDTVTASH